MGLESSSVELATLIMSQDKPLGGLKIQGNGRARGRGGSAPDSAGRAHSTSMQIP